MLARSAPELDLTVCIANFNEKTMRTVSWCLGQPRRRAGRLVIFLFACRADDRRVFDRRTASRCYQYCSGEAQQSAIRSYRMVIALVYICNVRDKIVCVIDLHS